MTGSGPWLLLFALGAYHGINPGMGWLFAVALGLQEKTTRAVLRALPPLALGHLLSIGIVISVLAAAHASIPQAPLRYGAAIVLFAFGFYRLARSRHPKWVGMRVGFGDLTLWSFLMASADGAGLMLIPVLLAWPGAFSSPVHMMHMHGPVAAGALRPVSALRWSATAGVHTLGYLVVTAAAAMLVYKKLGVAILRRAWFNLEFIWAIALIASAALIVIL